MLNEIQGQVGRWSQENFGYNKSKSPTNENVVLGSIAPVLGMFEELGELIESVSQEDRLDAVGDIGIYLCDYTYRENIPIDDLGFASSKSLQNHTEHCLSLTNCLGNLCHVVLKRHQGIRGYDNYDKYHSERMIHLSDLVGILNEYCREEFSRPFHSIVRETWEKIVQKRNWKDNAQNG